nr:MAG TPA: hypothetical protein [Caudoviricetes sp.]
MYIFFVWYVLPKSFLLCFWYFRFHMLCIC